MSNYRTPTTAITLAAVFAATLAVAGASAETTVSTAFTYQGQLKSAGVPFTGDAAFQFTLWDSAVDGRQIGEET